LFFPAKTQNRQETSAFQRLGGKNSGCGIVLESGGIMKKLGKILLGVAVVVVVLLLVAVLTLPMTIGPIVKTAASVGGPQVLGVPVSVGDVKLNPLAGNLTISQVKVGNPQGYSDKDAFAVEKVEVGLDIKSLLTDTIVIRKIKIDAPAIVFESKNGKSNFDTLLANAQKASAKEKTETEKEKKPGKKVVIDEFSLNNAKVSYASGLTLGKALTVPVPSVTVRDIGKTSGGVTAIDALTQIMNGILEGVVKAVTNVAGAANDLLKGIGGTASGAAKNAGEALKSVTGSAADTAGGAVKTAEDAAKSAADAAKSAADSLKKLNPFKK
jgi:hypothetical protein